MSTKTPLDDLTEKQQAFVIEFTKLGAERGTRIEACRKAGYEGDNLDVVAWDLMRKPKIVAAVKYMLDVRMLAVVPDVISATVELALDNEMDNMGRWRTSAATRLQAQKDIADRAGLAPVARSEQNINVTDTRAPTMLEFQERFRAALASVSLDPETKKLAEQKYLTAPVDAAFEEVPDLGFLDE